MDIFHVIHILRQVLEEAEARYRWIEQMAFDAARLDAVVVLSHGRFATQDGEIVSVEQSDECKRRVEFGAKFVNTMALTRPLLGCEHLSPTLVLCGAVQQMPAMREWALAMGVHEDVIVELAGTAFPATNTKTQFLDIGQAVQERDWRQVIVISSDYHLRCPLYGRRWLSPDVLERVLYAYLPMLTEEESVLGTQGQDGLSLLMGELERIVRYAKSGDLADPLEI